MIPDNALLEFIEQNYKTVQECLDAADALNMQDLFMEGDESLSDIMNAQSDVSNPDDGEHDKDNGATGDRFNDFMDQIPQMNPSEDDANSYDGDSEPPTYDDSQFANGYDSMPMPQQPMIGQPMMQPQPMMMQPPVMPMQQPMMPMGMPMMAPQPMVQPIPVAQPVQMPYYGQPMPPVQPMSQMPPGT